MRCWVLVLIVACRTTGSPAIENHEAAPRFEPCHLHGRVVDAKTSEPLAGAVVIITSGEDAKDVVSDEQGSFEVAMTSPRDQLTVYYIEQTLHVPLDDSCARPVTVRFPPPPVAPKPIIVTQRQ